MNTTEVFMMFSKLTDEKLIIFPFRATIENIWLIIKR